MNTNTFFLGVAIAIAVWTVSCAKKEEPPDPSLSPTVDTICLGNKVLDRTDTGWVYRKDSFGADVKCQ